jgi:arylsulfatase A-like enzyme
MPNRRAALALLAVALLDPGPGPSPARARAADRPDVVVIWVDDLNDWVGPLGGHPQAFTPKLDRLARRGTTFTNAHCQAPLCNPSRTSVLTGLRPSTTGVYALEPWFRTAPAWRDRVTLPQAFAAAGYETPTTGKVFHDAYPPPEGRRDGAEFSVWGYFGNHGPRPEQPFVHSPGGHPLVDWGIYPERDDQQEDYKVASWAVERLGSARERPMLLSVGFRRPHVPCYAPRPWFDRFPLTTLQLPAIRRDDRDDTPRFSWYLHWRLPEPRLGWLVAADEHRALVRAYLACTAFADAQIGRVLDAIEASGRADRTVVVVLSDHGWHLGEKGITGKNSLWEPSTRVPFLWAGPGIAPGAVCAQPVELLDLYPTLVDLCGLPPVAGLEGHSLRPQLADASAPRVWPALTTHGPGNHAVRTGTHRYIRHADGSEELYDLETDSREWTNLADRPASADRKAELARWLPATDATPLPGSRSRLVEWRGGAAYWEGQAIPADAPIPLDEPAPPAAPTR